MRVSGSVAIAGPREAVWDALQDPAVLGRSLPGCEALEVTGPDSYAATLTAGVASLRGTYRGTVEVGDRIAPESYRLTARGAGDPGTVSADALVRLEEDGGRTIVHYTADAIVGGIIAEVGQRLLAGVAHRTADEFFAAVERDLLSGPVASPRQLHTADVTVEQGTGAQQPEAQTAGRRSPFELVVAALIGAAAALIAVIAGRRTPRRSQ